MQITKHQEHPISSTAKRGFASMPKEKVREIAYKGGAARAAKAGHEGMAEMGRKGGKAKAAQIGHQPMAKRIKKRKQESDRNKDDYSQTLERSLTLPALS